jgi:large repetitive protein
LTIQKWGIKRVRNLFEIRTYEQAGVNCEVLPIDPIPMYKFLLFAVLSLMFSTSVRSQCTANAGSDQTVCAGQTIMLGGMPSATGGSGTYTYTWTGQSGIASVANPIVTPIATTTYTLSVNDGAGCITTDQVVITVTPLPAVNAGPDMSRCLNSPSVTLPNPGGAGVWSGAPPAMLTPAGVFTPNAIGTFTLTLSVTQNGCTATDQMVMQVRALPTVNAGLDQTICQGQTVQLGATATSSNGAITLYTWSGGAVSNSLSQNPTATPNSTVTYNVTAVDAASCSAQDQITVTVNLPPAVNAGPALTLCNDPVPTTLTGQTPAGGTWTGPGVTPGGVFTPSAAGTVVLTYSVTSPTGCVGSANRTINVVSPGTINAGPDQSACVGSPSFTLTPVTSGGTWSGSPHVTSGGVFTPSALGTFTLTYSLTIGTCNATDQIVVQVMPLPSVNAGLDQSVCAGQTVQLNASAVSTNGPITLYTWSGGAVSNSLIANPTAVPPATTVYNVTAVDNLGCSNQDQVTVSVVALPAVNAGADQTICHDGSSLTLTGQSPPGGVWSGTGVTPGGVFTSPAPGAYTLTYTFTNSNGCSASDTRVITSVSATGINAGNDQGVCLNSSALQLSAVTPGGQWSGSTWVTSSGLFTPGAAGTFNLTYSVNQGSCTATDQVTVTVHQLPQANAGADQTMCAGGSVTLNGSASGGSSPYSFQWFNGMASLGMGASVTLSPASTTTYTLVVNDNNSCSGSDQVQVTVTSLPTVNAGPNVQYCNNPVPETLTGYSPAGGVWSGPGVTSGGVFTPFAVGQYTLTYSFNSNGCSGSDQMVVTVGNGTAVNAGPDQTACISDGSFSLSSGTSSTGVWSGPGIANPSTGLINVNIAGSGVHSYTLTNGSGSCAYSDQIVVTLHGDPIVSAGSNQTICTGSGAVQLTGASPANGVWMGPQILDASAGTFNGNAAQGTYVVGYEYTDPLTGCTATAYKNVVVSAIPSASFASPAFVCIGNALTATNQSSGASSYSWNFGDGSPVQNSTNGSYSYSQSGSFQVTLTATNNAGCTAQFSQNVLSVAPPAAAMQLSVNEGCAPLEVDFTNLSQGDNLTCLWDFQIAQSTDHTPASQTFIEFNGITPYTISLSVSNQCGNHSASQQILVLPRPVADFSETITSTICSPVSVEFDDQSSGNPDQYIWNFGNGNVSAQQDPGNMVYTTDDEPTDYEVILVVQNECGIDSVTQVITVMPNLVEAAFSLSEVTACAPMNVAVTNLCVGATDYSWQIPGVFASNEVAPALNLTDPGNYTLFLYATDGCGSSSTQANITVLQSPEASIVTDSWETCEGVVVQYSAVTNGAADILWLLETEDDDDDLQFTGSTVTHTYSQADTYMVELHVTSANQCTADDQGEMWVHEPPVASFTATETEGCSPMNVCLTNASTGAESYQWAFGNGQVSPESDPCVVYMNESDAVSQMTIQLTATNQYQCTDTYEHVVSVLPTPQAGFTLPSEGTCDLPYVLNLSAEGTGNFMWTINGQQADATSQLSEELTQEGDYHIVLTVSNELGCADTHDGTFEVYARPVAAFEALPADGCVPHDVQFISTSTNASFYQWQFDNGATSTAQDPDMTYSQPGIYDITLTVTSVNGCTDEYTAHNLVEAYPLPEASFVPSMRETSIYYPEVTFENTSEGGATYQWIFGDGGSTSEEENPEHSFGSPGNWPVTLTVTSTLGCTDRYTDYVRITSDLMVFIPNAFTPDNDGLNDVFIPVMASTEFISSYELLVFDRWGTIVFQTDNPDTPWIGNVRGGDHFAATDSYHYRLVLKTTENTDSVVKEGTVTLLR